MKVSSTLLLVLLLCLSFLPAMLAQEQANDEETAEPLINREAAPQASAVQMQTVATGFNRPLYVTHAGDGSGRLFVVEQGGLIRVIQGGAILPQPFLDVSSLLTWDVATGAYTERGLLGLAFHPDYAENGRFFINYTDRDGATVVAEYRVSAASPNQADPASARILFTHPQPFPNHNGGHMSFGPDGYLYISLGDGGSANDPLNAGQDTSTLLGTLLRIDIDGDLPYGIPDDNPFVEGADGQPEIWAYGLRNVWRFSFDRATGDLYMGDVGQNQWEEINFEPADSPGGNNYGWNLFEASHVFRSGGNRDAVVMPIAEYNHSNGCSITGGYVYRGQALPELEGAYFYSDWCSGLIWTAYRDEAGNWQAPVFMNSDYRVASFGEDESGELYIVDYDGAILRFVPA